MTAVAIPRSFRPIATQKPRPTFNGRVVLTGINWDTYEALLKDLAARRIFLTYDQGNLEIMAPMLRHEKNGATLTVLVKTLANASKMRWLDAGSTTLRRADVERGLEADRCFYIQNVQAMLDKMELDLTVDPPPDLAIEIDITSSCLDRLEIYAALRVPEVWRFDGQHFEVLVRRDDTGYDRATVSPTFPGLAVAMVVDLLSNMPPGLDGAALERHVRAWVRKHAAPPMGKRAPRRKKK